MSAAAAAAGEKNLNQNVENENQNISNSNQNENLLSETLSNQESQANGAPAPAATGAIPRTRPDKSTGAIPKERPANGSPAANRHNSVKRACLVCSMVKTVDEWLSDGCDNCEEFLKIKSKPENMRMCTTPIYADIVFLKEPNWVVRWPRKINRCKGFYALSISVKLPNGLLREMKGEMRTLPPLPTETDTKSSIPRM